MADFYAARAGTNAGAPLDGFLTAVHTELLAVGRTLTIEEDGIPLGPAESLHEDIRQLGGGRFSIWGGHAYFSASDSSDCNQNGRNYWICADGRRGQ